MSKETLTEETVRKMAAVLAEMPFGTANRWSEATTMLYVAALSDLDDCDVRQAVTYAIRHDEFRPSPARLREIVDEMRASSDTSFAGALAEVQTLIRKFGSHAAPHPSFPDNPNIRQVGAPKFSSQIIAKTIEALGGWVSVCEEPVPSGVFRAQFERIFTAFAKGASDADMALLRTQLAEERRSAAMIDAGPAAIAHQDHAAPVASDGEALARVMSVAAARNGSAG